MNSRDYDIDLHADDMVSVERPGVSHILIVFPLYYKGRGCGIAAIEETKNSFPVELLNVFVLFSLQIRSLAAQIELMPPFLFSVNCLNILCMLLPFWKPFHI